jgi:hypothetical protein
MTLDGGLDSSSDDEHTARRRHTRSTSPTSRALSAGRTRISELQTRLTRLNASMTALKKENRDLRWRQKLAERKLENYEVERALSSKLVRFESQRTDEVKCIRL